MDEILWISDIIILYSTSASIKQTLQPLKWESISFEKK